MNYPKKVVAEQNEQMNNAPILTLECLMAFIGEAAYSRPFLMTVEYNTRDRLHRPVLFASRHEHGQYNLKDQPSWLLPTFFELDMDMALFPQMVDFYSQTMEDETTNEELEDIEEAVTQELKRLCVENDDYLHLENLGIRIWE